MATTKVEGTTEAGNSQWRLEALTKDGWAAENAMVFEGEPCGH